MYLSKKLFNDNDNSYGHIKTEDILSIEYE